MSDEPDDAPTEIWIINGKPTRVRIGGHALADLQFTHALAEAASDLIVENKRLQTELRYKQVIERFNRAHGQNRRITLKQICEQMGVSYDAVRTYRSRTKKRKTKK